MIDQLADLNARGLAEEHQRIADDVKYDVRERDEENLLTYVNELHAIDDVIYGKYDR